MTGELTYRDPTLKPAAPFVKPPLHMDYGLRVRVGSTTFINRYCMILDTPVADVVIGERCNIGPHCAILSVGHPLGRERITKRNSNGREVRIGNGVWIGARVTIMYDVPLPQKIPNQFSNPSPRGGVTIGDGAVIGACSLVTHSIPPGVLAFGVPAEVVRILDDSDDDDSCGDVASAETLEEALRVKTEHPALDKDENDAAMIYHRPFRGRQQPLGGGQNHDRRLTRAEIFALVALGVSFFTSFFFAALVVVCKDAVVRIATGGGQDL